MQGGRARRTGRPTKSLRLSVIAGRKALATTEGVAREPRATRQSRHCALPARAAGSTGMRRVKNGPTSHVQSPTGKGGRWAIGHGLWGKNSPTANGKSSSEFTLRQAQGREFRERMTKVLVLVLVLVPGPSPGFQVLNLGSWILDLGSWILDLGF